AVVKTLGQVGKDTGVVFIRVSPVRRNGLAAVVMGFASVAIPGWQTAPGRIGGVTFLVFIAYGEGRAIGDVGIHHAIEEFFTVVVVIHSAVVVLVTGDQTTAHLAGFYQRGL